MTKKLNLLTKFVLLIFAVGSESLAQNDFDRYFKTPDYGVIKSGPYKPTSTPIGNESRDECKRMQSQWDTYWSELGKRHEECLKQHEGERYGYTEDCSIPACQQFHNPGSQDADVRTELRNCFLIAEKREYEEKQRELDEKNEAERKKRETELANLQISRERSEPSRENDKKKEDSEKNDHSAEEEKKESDAEREARIQEIVDERKSRREDFKRELKRNKQAYNDEKSEYDKKTQELNDKKNDIEVRSENILSSASAKFLNYEAKIDAEYGLAFSSVKEKESENFIDISGVILGASPLSEPKKQQLAYDLPNTIVEKSEALYNFVKRISGDDFEYKSNLFSLPIQLAEDLGKADRLNIEILASAIDVASGDLTDDTKIQAVISSLDKIPENVKSVYSVGNLLSHIARNNFAAYSQYREELNPTINSASLKIDQIVIDNLKIDFNIENSSIKNNSFTKDKIYTQKSAVTASLIQETQLSTYDQKSILDSWLNPRRR